MKRILRQAGLCGLIVAMTSIAAFTQSSDSRSTKRLAELNAAIIGNAQSSLLGRDAARFERAAKERYQLLSSLVESSPAEALRYALSPDDISKIPVKYSDLFEKQVELSGELEVIAECEENNFKTLRFIKTTEGTFEVFFENAPAETTGAAIELSGIEIDGKVAVKSYSTSEAENLTNTTGEKRVLVILVNFQDKQTQPYTREHASNITLNTTNSFFQENSYGQTWLTGDVYGWYTIPVSSTTCDIHAIGSYARQAATNAGANISQYTNLVYAFPSNACAFSGTGTLGGTPAQTWMRGDRFGIEVLGHELGHNYGLEHSRSLDCGAEVVNGTCTINEYGDTFDLMGPGAPHHYNLYQKERLGWFNIGSAPTLQSVSASGTYNIEPYETLSGGPKGLKILRSVDPVTGARSWYYIEHRTPTGFDSGLSVYNIQNGVVVHTGTEGDGRENYLLDMTPSTSSWYDSVLAQGQTYTDVNLGMSVTVLSADNSGATVQVQVAAQPCVRANPTISVTPGQSVWMLAGAAFTYQVTVSNNNSGGCSSESFNLGAALPNGFGASFMNSSLNLANGVSGTTSVNVASNGSSLDGTYNIGFSAGNASSPGNSASATASYVLISRLGVTATPGSATYTRNQTATVTSVVTAAGVPIANATVTFTMIKPGGRSRILTLTTGADGRAVFTHKFDRKLDSPGTYNVSAVSNFNGRTGQASTTFVVTR